MPPQSHFCDIYNKIMLNYISIHYSSNKPKIKSTGPDCKAFSFHFLTINMNHGLHISNFHNLTFLN